MEQSIHTKSKSGLQKSSRENKADKKIAVQSAVYLKDFEILLSFSNGKQRIVNFLPQFSKLSGAYSKYFLPNSFKKFIVKNGNIYWGKNEEVIFPVHQLYTGKYSTIPKEEILYVL
jgi:hypothetical protein